MDTWNLKDGYVARLMSNEEFNPLFTRHTKAIFDDETQVLRLREILSETERGKLKNLGDSFKAPFEICLGVFQGDEMVGWHYGRQDSQISFYMQNSGVLPQHRRKGLYSEMLKIVIQIATEKGFQAISSRHRATNNWVIIPKLKHGFLITALETSDLFGTLVHLTYFPNPKRRKVLNYRVGHTKPDEEIKSWLKI